MLKHERTNSWKKEHLEIVKRKIPRYIYRLGESNNFKNTVSKEIINSFDIFISSDDSKKCFCVYDMRIHRFIHSGENITLNAKISFYNLIKLNFTTQDIYNRYIFRYAKNGYESAYEKVLIVGEDVFYEFCCHYEEYLKPNKIDIEYNDPVYYVDDNNALSVINSQKSIGLQINEREIYKIFRYRRNSVFRKQILEKYNYTCVVCGCKEPKILEAAHIRSVCDGGNDSVENGLCLCSNHHKLFDSGLLKIDISKGIFECFSSAEMNSIWYKEAIKRDLKLFLK